MTDVQDLLNRKRSEIRPPKPLPNGTYLLSIPQNPRLGESRQNKTPFWEFQFKIEAAGEDVDRGQLPENWQGKTIRHQFFLTENALHLLEKFLVIAGVPGANMKEAQTQCEGRKVLAEVEAEQDQNDKDQFYHRIRGFGKYEG